MAVQNGGAGEVDSRPGTPALEKTAAGPVPVGGQRLRLGFYADNRIIGGAERYLMDLLEWHDRARYDIRLFTNRNERFTEYVAKRQLRGIPHRIVPLVPQLVRRGAGSGGAWNPAGTGRQPRIRTLLAVGRQLWMLTGFGPNVLTLFGAFRSARLDVLHINNGGYPGAESCRQAAIAAALARIPVRIMSVHNLARSPAVPIALDRSIDQHVFGALHQVVTHSEASRESLERLRGCPAERLRCIHYGIADLVPPSPNVMAARRADLRLCPEDQVVGMVAGFEERKGHRYLLEAFRDVVRACPRAKLLLVGEGELRAAMTSLARELGLAGTTVFTGFRDDVPDLMALCDVIVLSSVGCESLPYVILEAMALKKPVVATTVAGIPEELEDGRTGLLVPPRAPLPLANGIVSLLSDEDMRTRLGHAARRRFVDRFGAARMTQALEELYVRPRGA